MGIRFVVAPEYRLPQLNSVRVPEGADDRTVRWRLLEEYNIEIGAGLGQFAGKIWRIGLMGCSSTLNHVNMLLSALRTIMVQSV
jgi:alanine-glyoxylate transaminase/serine-glyoxylate transaminase/serine-pyruvate transaminase